MYTTALTLKNLFEGWDLVIILAIVILLFGSTKLPELARGMGRSIRIFKSEMNDGKEDAKTDEPAQIEVKPESSETLTTEAAKTEEPQTK